MKRKPEDEEVSMAITPEHLETYILELVSSMCELAVLYLFRKLNQNPFHFYIVLQFFYMSSYSCSVIHKMLHLLTL